MPEEIQTIPQEVNKVLLEYIGTNVPYYIENRSKQLKKKVYKGKGSIDEIRNKLNNLKNDLKEDILNDKETLLKGQIGIDCSGFITYLYDAYTTKNLGKHVWELYERKTMNPLNMLMFKYFPITSKMNANTLTSAENCIKIDDIKNIKPMDLFRMSGGAHVAMVKSVIYQNGRIKRIEYVHSSEGIGVCIGTIENIDENKSIFDQNWIPMKDLGAKYDPGYLIRYKINNNGIFRPKFLANK